MVLPAFLRIYAASPQRDDDRSVFAGRDCDAEGAYSLLRVLDSPPCLDSPIRGVYSPIKKLWGRTPRNHCKTRIFARSPATVPAGGHLRPSLLALLQQRSTTPRQITQPPGRLLPHSWHQKVQISQAKGIDTSIQFMSIEISVPNV